jgi:hypothetical protein
MWYFYLYQTLTSFNMLKIKSEVAHVNGKVLKLFTVFLKLMWYSLSVTCDSSVVFSGNQMWILEILKICWGTYNQGPSPHAIVLKRLTSKYNYFKRFFGDMMKTTCCSYNRCHLNHLSINKLVTPKNIQSPVSNKYCVVYHILPVSLDCPFGIL